MRVTPVSSDTLSRDAEPARMSVLSGVSFSPPAPAPGAASFSEPALAIARALTDLRAGRPVEISDGTTRLRLHAAEALPSESLAALLAGAHVRAALSGPRLEAIGATEADDRSFPLAPDLTAGALLALAAAPDAALPVDSRPADALESGALALVKLAGFLPLVLLSPAGDDSVPQVALAALAGFRAEVARTLRPVSAGRVPMDAGPDTRLQVFRDALGGTAVAVLVGRPDPSRPLPIRIHSSCLTGDVFGSRRCDCGAQLALGLQRVRDLGGGAVLYLDQEGRGIGLAAKMRAYDLQDAGLDTVDANRMLGFHEDERDYTAAGVMLMALGWRRVTLLTNNPLKIAALEAEGIEVTGRLPVITRPTAENRTYLATKASRSGHWLDQPGRDVTRPGDHLTLAK
ncbi:GTP cyclohydrolase II [Segnochrobactraceae bacterium EtOH-i3]